MREVWVLGFWFAVLVLAAVSTGAFGLGEKRVRPPARAGQWYQATSSGLARQVDGLLSRAPSKEVPGHLLALIEPHAGYAYSGPTAAAGFKLLRGKPYHRVVLLGVPHLVRVVGCSLPEFTHYRTPLGEVPLDLEACNELLKSRPFHQFTRAHLREHSIEAELPFLQRTLSDFRIVPILVGEISESDRRQAAQALRSLIDEDTLFVVSSDFTHYGAEFGYLPFRQDIKRNLDKLDHGAVKHILALDPDGFVDYFRRTGVTICGRNGIALLLEVLKPLDGVTAVELAYTTSGDLTGDWSHCVSYCTIAFARSPSAEGRSGASAGQGEQPSPAGPSTQPPPSSKAGEVVHHPAGLSGPQFLSPEDEQYCLRLARRSLRHYFRTGRLLQVSGSEVPAALRKPHGCFVTLKKRGRLRGCIGRIVGDRPLYLTIIEYAVHAAVDDPRFRPVSKNELDELDIEISVMTPLERVTDVDDIQVGRDGLLIKMGFNQGLLLPQVATEFGWDRETFLVHTCRKAGLPDDAWKSPRAQIYRFSAQVFGEKK